MSRQSARRSFAPCKPAVRRKVLGALASLLIGAPAALAQPSPPAADCASPAPASPDEVAALATLRLGQRIRPSQVDREWAIQPKARDVAAEQRAAEEAGATAAWLESLRPAHLRSRRLEAELCRYRRLAAAGGWTPLPSGGPLREGTADPAVASLRRRLAAEGYRLAPSAATEAFDAALGDALRAFQRRHGLEPDGVLGPATRLALDVPAVARAQQLEANLERWRWLPASLPPDRIEVDVGFAEAVLYRGDAPVLAMRAIVGDPRHRTPMFASQLESVVFNPPWNVPASIARNEIWPKAARDPRYLARNRFVRTPNGLQQAPGPKNALGQLKFDLPSPFGVYLHDTPGRAAFARPMRALSHGCMRLEKPRLQP